nr:septal ring lytic transglycosylase RlpA family protein [Methylocystis heyeri]
MRLAVRQPLIGHAMLASFYGGGPRKYEPNSHTANGERFNQWGFTAAHRTLPFGTKLRVCFSGCAVVRINDRGPARWTGRSLDLSRGAASVVGLVRRGVGTVRVAILGR